MTVVGLLIVALLQASVSPRASVVADAPFIAVANAWIAAWNRHDMNALADVVAEDVDFITVGGNWLQGRVGFKAHHAERHATNFRDSTFAIRVLRVQRLRPDVVLMHIETIIRGDRNQDGTPRPPARDTIMTWMLMESGGRWRIRMAQNTNVGAAEPLK
jgi:uncharacterized protein (TIGR02246 family)